MNSKFIKILAYIQLVLLLSGCLGGSGQDWNNLFGTIAQEANYTTGNLNRYTRELNQMSNDISRRNQMSMWQQQQMLQQQEQNRQMRMQMLQLQQQMSRPYGMRY